MIIILGPNDTVDDVAEYMPTDMTIILNFSHTLDQRQKNFKKEINTKA